ncbi:MAG: gamma-glutamyl-gamma-aminobutyrate hydrolase family protein [Verrucomicrobiota bacterium]|nr:gamma-glutamyl-gamma-aminobutyrate hydrolase family protein [Verrucomicrobiota bacterium]
MPTVLSWIRECDEQNFARFWAALPDVVVENARVAAHADLEKMDGLLLTGGPDIAAEFLHQHVDDPSLVRDAEAERDAWELEALKRALDLGKPVLAVCKGVQVLNVALGGTLFLDIPGHDSPETKTANIQPLQHSTAAKNRYDFVNSSHHQALDRPGDGLDVEAWCKTDGIVEQVRLRNYPFGVGVQYHPERDLSYSQLFADFFEAVSAAALTHAH